MLLTPEYIFRAIEAITPEFLRQHGITALVLDVYNTLTGDGSQQLDATVQQWLDTMRAAGVRDRKSTRLNSSHVRTSRMPSSA